MNEIEAKKTIGDIFRRDFTKELEGHPEKTVYDLFDWKYVDVDMKNFKTGETIFDLKHLEFPEEYSQNACNIIASKYEAIVEKTEDSHAYRTARRKNRDKWVGYNASGQGEAFAKNITSNIGHGVFNLAAAGLNAIGDSIKKNEIFKILYHWDHLWDCNV